MALYQRKVPPCFAVKVAVWCSERRIMVLWKDLAPQINAEEANRKYYLGVALREGLPYLV